MGMTETTLRIKRYGNIAVTYSSDTDGGGSLMTPAFVTFIRNHSGVGHRFGTMFEWCAGPGFIAFALLAEEMCDSVCLADINPTAIEYVRTTIAANHLEDRARCYVSDNLLTVPKTERFDLVVGNPPNYYALNPKHPNYDLWKNDRRANDPGWRIHAAFYSQIGAFLNDGAHVVVQEVEPYSREIFQFCDSTPYDIRPEAPGPLFKEMMRRGGLEHVGDFPLPTAFGDSIKSWVQVSRKAAQRTT